MSNNYPLVCICIPLYNNEATIEATLDSLIHQTYKNIVIKIFDNVSTDNSMLILKKYEILHPNIYVFQNDINIGGEANFTRCIENLEGDFGAIFHADDVYYSTMVEEQVKCLLKNDIVAVFVRANLINEKSSFIGDQFFPNELTNLSYYQFDFKQLFSLILKYDNFLITPSVMAVTDIYKNKIKFWRESLFKTSADLDVWLRFGEIGNIGIITNKLMGYRISEASYSFRQKFIRILPRDMFMVIDFYLNKYKNSFDQTDYEYLKFKDNIIITGNKILNNIVIDTSNIRLCNMKIFKKVIVDKKKFKIYVYAFLIKMFMHLKLKNITLLIIKKANKL